VQGSGWRYAWRLLCDHCRLLVYERHSLPEHHDVRDYFGDDAPFSSLEINSRGVSLSSFGPWWRAQKRANAAKLAPRP
jgi:hypothetical protein